MVRLRQTVIDTLDARISAEFWRAVLGRGYRTGDEPESGEQPRDWLVLRAPGGGSDLAFQRVAELARPSWPHGPVPQQLHLDLTVADVAELDAEHDRMTGLGAELLLDCREDREEPLRVYADPSGHPFCIFVA